MSPSITRALILVITGTCLFMGASTEHESILYFEDGNENFGSFFRAPNFAIDSAVATHILTKNVNECSCKSACFVVSCRAWSVVNTTEGVECRLSRKGPLESTPLEIEGASYFFLEDAVGDYDFDPSDIQFVFAGQSANHSDAKRLCTSLPGHRLLMPKSKSQLDFYTNRFGAHLIVDLIRYMNETGMYHIWGDGAPVSTSEGIFVTDLDLGDNYVNMFGGLVAYADGQYQTICQTNPYGVNW